MIKVSLVMHTPLMVSSSSDDIVTQSVRRNDAVTKLVLAL